MSGDFTDGFLRSKGYIWLASRPRIAGVWSQAGVVLSAQPGGYWWAETPRKNGRRMTRISKPKWKKSGMRKLEIVGRSW